MTNSEDDELILSGDGKTRETAVKFRPCHIRTRIARERRFVSEQYGVENLDWSEWLHFTTMDGHSLWSVELSDGTMRSVYFDTSATIYDED